MESTQGVGGTGDEEANPNQVSSLNGFYCIKAIFY